VAKTDHIELPTGEKLVILYEDRAVLAIDKPAGWMLVPFSWQRTQRNLQAALSSSMAAKDFWARSRNLKFLRYVHRLDAGTTGILLFAKSQGALTTYGELFESRGMEKTYLAVVQGVPRESEWTCLLRIGEDARRHGRMRPDKNGKTAETRFRSLQTAKGKSLLEAFPYTGRTHQSRVHLAESGHAVVGDDLYGPQPDRDSEKIGLRAVTLAYNDPFNGRRVEIHAPASSFIKEYGFDPTKL
jgi:23S rRNA pseudouridine1911/1915/1917 synthase